MSQVNNDPFHGEQHPRNFVSWVVEGLNILACLM